VIVDNLSTILNFVYIHFQGVPALASVGAYGVTIVVFTIGIRLALSPLAQFQLVTTRKSALEQRKLAPDVAELRKKFKKDPARINTETQKLYAEHGINPLAGMVGCLPLVVQTPILIALYWVFTGFAHHATIAAHFLFVPNLNENPNHHVLFMLPFFGIGVPAWQYLVFPLLAGVTTFVQTKMMQMPVPPNPTEMELQTQQMQKMMVWLSPLMIAYFALNVPAGLGLYYFVSNCVGIIQQYFVVGWGNLIPGRVEAKLALVDQHRGGNKPRVGADIGPKIIASGPKSRADIGPKDIAGGSENGSKNGPQNGARNGPQNGSKTVPQNGRNKKKKKR
jgi:YidC/Oxa1 family membrane protein insertase